MLHVMNEFINGVDYELSCFGIGIGSKGVPSLEKIYFECLVMIWRLDMWWCVIL